MNVAPAAVASSSSFLVRGRRQHSQQRDPISRRPSSAGSPSVRASPNLPVRTLSVSSDAHTISSRAAGAGSVATASSNNTNNTVRLTSIESSTSVLLASRPAVTAGAGANAHNISTPAGAVAAPSPSLLATQTPAGAMASPQLQPLGASASSSAAMTTVAAAAARRTSTSSQQQQQQHRMSSPRFSAIMSATTAMQVATATGVPALAVAPSIDLEAQMIAVRRTVRT